MKYYLLIVLVFFFGVNLFALEEAKGKEKSPGISAKDMQTEAEAKSERAHEIEKGVHAMITEAVQENDIKWKIGLDAVMTTVKGIVESIDNTKDRMNDHLKIAEKAKDAATKAESMDAANNQLMLIRGFAASAETAMVDANNCARQNTKIDTDTKVVKAENKQITGTSEQGTVNEALGMDFSSGFVTESDKTSTSSTDFADSGGSDITGGPTETPSQKGSTPESIKNNDPEKINPPQVPVSGE